MIDIKAHIVLLGFMGSGKSTIGTIVADACGIPFVDLDTYIESKEKRKIAQIFASDGEDAFRKLERKYLKEVMKISKPSLISLGGGTPCFFDNIKTIQSHSCISFYLKVGVDRLLDRLSNDSERPLLHKKSKSELRKFISSTMKGRQVYYNQADKTIRASNHIEVVSQRIIKYVKKAI